MESILLTDFGSAFSQRDDTYTHVQGTALYKAPERYTKDVPSSKSDLWYNTYLKYSLIIRHLNTLYTLILYKYIYK